MEIKKLEEGDLVWGTVDRIMGTVVFVKIDDYSEEGTIIESEITSGRVKNIRDYVVPKKRVVCKVIRVSGDRIDLSMRRVSAKEQKELKDLEEKERNSSSILKTVLGQKALQVISEIKKKEKIFKFLEEAKENSKNLENLVGKEEAKKIIEILKNQKQKKQEVKKEILMNTQQPDGISLIKGLLKNINAKYLAAGKYIIISEAEDIKTADNNLKKILEELMINARKKGVELVIK